MKLGCALVTALLILELAWELRTYGMQDHELIYAAIGGAASVLLAAVPALIRELSPAFRSKLVVLRTNVILNLAVGGLFGTVVGIGAWNTGNAVWTATLVLAGAMLAISGWLGGATVRSENLGSTERVSESAPSSGAWQPERANQPRSTALPLHEDQRFP